MATDPTTPAAPRLRPATRLWLAAAALALMGGYSALRFRLATDLLQFLDSPGDARATRLAQRVADSELTRALVLSVEAGDGPAAAAAARGLAERLKSHPEVARVRSGVDGDQVEGVYNLYFSRRFGLLTDEPSADAALSPEGLRQAAARLKDDLNSPLGPLVKRAAREDPLQLFAAQLRRLEASKAGPLKVIDGQLVSDDERHGVVILSTRSSPFDGEKQRPLAEAVQGAFAALKAEQGPALRLEQSGLSRYALSAEASIRADIERISALSTVGIAVVCLALFRSLRSLLLSMLSMGIGFVVATFATLLFFGQLHGLTWAFGSSLLGVCIDYPLHLFNHHMLQRDPAGAEGSARKIWVALLMGALTTLAGFAGLGWTTFPGLREFAVFASVGILAALWATRWILPPLMAGMPEAGPAQRRLAAALGALLRGMLARPAVAWGLLLAALATCAAGAGRLRFVDDVRALNAVDPALLAEDERVRARVSQMDAGRMLVSLGRDDEEALARNDALHAALGAAQRRGVLEDFRSMHALLWSAALQRRNIEALRSLPAARVDEALAAEGFKPQAFEAFHRARAGAPPPLTMADLLASPLGDLARSLRVEVDGEVGLVTLVRGVRDEQALAAAAAAVPGVVVVDKSAIASKTYGRYRRRAVELLGLGLVAVWGLVFARYRRLSLVLASCAPAVLASAAALSIIALLGHSLTLLHVVATLLVLSMGVDYGIFLVESGDDEALEATLLSMLAGCVLTALSFGLLAMSGNPALKAIGLTTGLGNSLSLLLAPAGLIFARSRRA